jgi:hypothetical protein
MDRGFDSFEAAPHRSSVENAPYGVCVRRLDDVEPDDFFSLRPEDPYECLS